MIHGHAHLSPAGRILHRQADIPISPARVAELAQTMYEMSFTLPGDAQRRRILLQMDDEQRQVYELLY